MTVASDHIELPPMAIRTKGKKSRSAGVTMSVVGTIEREIAQTVASAFGGRPDVYAFYDESGEASIDLASRVGTPITDTTSYSTLGLSQIPLLQNGIEYQTRVELVGAARSNFTEMANIVASCAFSLINDGLFLAPGVILPGVIAGYRPSAAMKNVLFVPSFLWENGLAARQFEDRTVAWLMIVPISDAEMKVAVEARSSAPLETTLERMGIDLYDLDRTSTV